MGPRLGANKVVAGNTIPELINTIEYLNDKNIAVTVDNLGEFVGTVEESNHAKEQIFNNYGRASSTWRKGTYVC